MRKECIAILTSVLFVSCGITQKVAVHDLGSPELKSLRGNRAVVEVMLKAENNSPWDLHVKRADIEILRDGYSFGTATLSRRATIAKRSGIVETPLLFDVEISDRPAIMSGRIKAIFDGSDKTRLSFSGKIRAGTKLVSKSLNFRNLSPSMLSD
jgi:hypothetical protein